jgi:hypothetical protein
MIVNGRLELRPGAQVTDVTLINSTLDRAPDATIAGEVRNQTGFVSDGLQRALSSLFWLSMTVVVIAAGLLFAAVGGRQLLDAGQLIVSRMGGTIVAALIVSILLPVIAVLSFITIIGIPLGFTIFVLLIVLWFLGYLVAGATFGVELVNRLGRGSEGSNLYLAVAVGLLLFQLIGLIPVVGFVVTTLAGFLGAGALAFLTWRAWRSPGAPGREPAPPGPGRAAPTA